MDLLSTLGTLLPAALGVAISPIPIIATVLMLLSPRAGRTAPAFAVGWVLGLTGVIALAIVLAGPSAADTGAHSERASWAQLVLGVLFLLLAWNAWRRRPAPGTEPTMPSWLAGLDKVSPTGALGLGLLLSAVNPKNLALGVAGGVAIAAGNLSTGAEITSIVVFVAIASILVVGPVVAYLVARQRMSGPLESLKDFMAAHNAAIMMVLLGALGLSSLGKGLGGLLG